MKLTFITTVLVLATFNSLSFAGSPQTNLTWKDKGLIKQKITFTIKVKSALLQDLKLIRRDIPNIF